MNFFKVLGIAEKYDIDNKALHKKYLELQASYHPDKASNLEAKNNFIILSSNINKAYEVLKNDLTRAEHLLELNNIKVNNKKLSPQEVEIIINSREQLETISNIKELQKVFNNKTKKRTTLITNLKKAFLSKDLDTALDLTIALKYLTKLLGDIKLRMDNAINRD